MPAPAPLTFDFDKLQAAIADLRAKQVFFVCGAAKSGTTWLQLLLDAHPNVVCRGEGHFADHLLPALRTALDRHNKLIAHKNGAIFTEIAGHPLFRAEHCLQLWTAATSLLLAENASDPAVAAVGEKTPDNVRFLPLFDVAFPRAKFIHIIRDGRDCAVSCWFHNQRVTPQWTSKTYPTIDAFIARFARGWAAEVGAGRKFGAQRPARYAELRYEDLIADTPGCLARLFAHLGVAADDDIVRACCERASFERLSRGRARGDEDRASFFRKGTTGDARNHLGAESLRLFESKAGECLSALGYKP